MKLDDSQESIMDKMKQLKKHFLEESFENISLMESELLSLHLENIDACDEKINTVFRAIHSIKGGSGIFELNHITEFSHVVESLLEQIRSHQQLLSQTIIELLLQSVDLIKNMLFTPSSLITQDALITTTMLLQQFIDNVSFNIIEPATSKMIETPQELCEHAIFYQPLRETFIHGCDPLLTLYELHRLGKIHCSLNIDSLPSLSDLNVTHCYLSWNIKTDARIQRKDIGD
jgi:two-component system chemotaxis sensor kinase CheA